MLTLCPETLPPALSDDPEALMANHQLVAELYHVCRLKHLELALACTADEPDTVPRAYYLQRFWWWHTGKNKNEESPANAE